MYPICYQEAWKCIGIHQVAGPVGSGPTGCGSGFSVMPKARQIVDYEERQFSISLLFRKQYFIR